MKVGITGQSGFIGWHLTQFLILQNVEIISFKKEYFSDVNQLNYFTSQCDIVVHLAGVNRHNNPELLYKENIDLMTKLINSCQNNPPKIYFASSIQELEDNHYGRSKRDAWILLESWAKKNNVGVGCFVIPNVFGPFCKPNYNSFVATFCYKIINGDDVGIIQDNEIKLIHVHDLVKLIWSHIQTNKIGHIEIPYNYSVKVSRVLEIIKNFKTDYLDSGVMPNLEDRLVLQLFNMFRTYIDELHFPVSYKKNTDNRGSFVEVVRSKTSGQFSFSTTKPGITRGNHFHTRKAERFSVIKGQARIQLRKIGSSNLIEYVLDGGRPSYVDMPIWYTHNITNIGSDELITLFWINEPYNDNDADTYFVNV